MKSSKEKLRRKRGHELNKIFSAKSFMAVTDPHEYMAMGMQFFSRRVPLKNGNELMLSEYGYAQKRTVAAIVDDLNLFDGFATYSEIASAIDEVFSELVSSNQVPDDSAEFIALVKFKVDPLIDEHTFAYPLYGVELEEGKNDFALGSFTICRPTIECLGRQGMQSDDKIVSKVITPLKDYLLLVGTEKGTIKVASERFKYRAKLLTGILAVIAAANYEKGAGNFRIGIVTSPETAYGISTSFNWRKQDPSPTVVRNFVSKQELKLTSSFLETSKLKPIVDDFLSILANTEMTEIQKAIVNAIYWFSDAHLDSVAIMQFVKYFSCIESFFSSERAHITQNLSQGLAAILAYGGLDYVKNSEYSSVKSKISRRYEHRSTAIHDGLHNHVSKNDTAELSQWTAWMILTLMMATKQGLRTLKQLKSITESVDSQHTRNVAT